MRFSPSAASISKRQSLAACQQLVIRERCSNGLRQAAANAALDCDMLDVAEQFRGDCQRNSMGEFCDLEIELSFDYTYNITVACGSSVTTCSSECRDQIMLARNALGCCINVGLNDSSSSVYTPEQFTYALWSTCSVEPVTEECSPSTVNLRQRSGRPCTEVAYIEQTLSIWCTRRFVEPVLEKLAATPGCELTLQSTLKTLELCAVNEEGQFCILKHPVLFDHDQYQNVSDICDDVETCEPACNEALQSLNNTFGCCINYFYNDSLTGNLMPIANWLSFDFWTQCNLTTPGFCETRFSSAFQTKEFGVTATTSAAVLFLITLF